MKNKKAIITSELVKKIAKLANLSIDDKRITKLKPELESSFDYINTIQTFDTQKVEETSQVTGLENIFREDKVDDKRLLSQKHVLSTAPSIYNGYFKVKAIFNEE